MRRRRGRKVAHTRAFGRTCLSINKGGGMSYRQVHNKLPFFMSAKRTSEIFVFLGQI